LNNWIDCGNFEMLIDSNRELLKRDKLKNYSENASVEDSQLKGNVSLFENSSVKNSKLKNTIVFPNAVIEDCTLHDSVIGEECVIKNLKGKIICSGKTIINK
jgi:glucose-1-phosphate thymidylyltransferase